MDLMKINPSWYATRKFKDIYKRNWLFLIHFNY